MDKEQVIAFLSGEIERTNVKLKGLARRKREGEGPRTSWSSRDHLDTERDIATLTRYHNRCRAALNCLSKSKPTARISEGTIATLSVDGEVNSYIFVAKGGGLLAISLLFQANRQ